MKRICLAILAVIACDPLVGGLCAPGYAPSDEGVCIADHYGAGAGTGAGAGGDAAQGGAGTGASGGSSTGGSSTGAGGTGGDPSTGTTIPLVCLPGLTRCNRGCVDLETDPDHCGQCSNVCPTGLCADAACLGGGVGHVVVIGMNYTTSTAATRTLLGNAAFLPKHDPARVLAYTEYGESTSVGAVHAILAQQANLRGRKLDLTPSSSVSFVTGSLDIVNHDVLLIHDQSQVGPSGMTNVALAMESTLQHFVDDGGTIVVLATSNPPMSAFLQSSALLDNTGLVPLSGTVLLNQAPGSAVGVGVPSPLLAPAASAGFATGVIPEASLTFVLRSELPGTLPVVVHRVISP